MMQPLMEERAVAVSAPAGVGRLGSTLGALAVGVAVLLAAFWPEARAAVSVWDASPAYGHCYLVLPMALYLMWERRSVCTGLRAHTELGWVALAIPLVLGWFAAER